MITPWQKASRIAWFGHQFDGRILFLSMISSPKIISYCKCVFFWRSGLTPEKNPLRGLWNWLYHVSYIYIILYCVIPLEMIWCLPLSIMTFSDFHRLVNVRSASWLKSLWRRWTFEFALAGGIGSHEDHVSWMIRCSETIYRSIMDGRKWMVMSSKKWSKNM